ncbi:hypothetical protein [Sorangium sp. So ce388]|uniref:hypothetical protein n=1 Tax=Sorangium sp. So ce388 TaxID=3133309 RepID=UPI003F5C5207
MSRSPPISTPKSASSAARSSQPRTSPGAASPPPSCFMASYTRNRSRKGSALRKKRRERWPV